MPSYLSYLKNVAFDAKDDDIQEWITVRGNHIPIKKGQTKEEAVKSFIESKGGKERSLSNGGYTKGLSNKEHEKIERHNALVKEVAELTKKADNEAFNKTKKIFAGEGTKEENEAFIKSVEKVFGKKSVEAENARKKFGGTTEKSNPVSEEVGFGALEIAYNDVDFGSNADTNKKLLLNAIHESGHEEEAAIAKLVESMPTDNFKDVDSFRKALSGERNDASAHVAAMHKFQAETGIAPEDYEAYEGVRQSGITNMFDVGTVMQLSGLPRNKVLDIMKHYSEARKVYGDDED